VPHSRESSRYDKHHEGTGGCGCEPHLGTGIHRIGVGFMMPSMLESSNKQLGYRKMTERILLLHPGEMGSSIGAALRSAGHSVCWVSEGRTEATQQRAGDAGLNPRDDLKHGLRDADHVISVCPPHAAIDVAEAVAGVGFTGTYVDANAISPESARRVSKIIGRGFVDGGIVGPPAWRAGATRLYLSGNAAELAASWFKGTLVDARVVDGSASALKMCYAAYTKGTSALVLAIRALADSEGVTNALLAEWDISQAGLADRSEAVAKSTSKKAWRFEGEMREIAQTFAESGLPSGFHEAAADVYRRMSGLKAVDDVNVQDVIVTLLGRAK
jgi:3-hydroxyisobutyrate dehydrogenase-like beta-hydroxyacid dehydrogenase